MVSDSKSDGPVSRSSSDQAPVSPTRSRRREPTNALARPKEFARAPSCSKTPKPTSGHRYAHALSLVLEEATDRREELVGMGSDWIPGSFFIHFSLALWFSNLIICDHFQVSTSNQVLFSKYDLGQLFTRDLEQNGQRTLVKLSGRGFLYRIRCCSTPFGFNIGPAHILESAISVLCSLSTTRGHSTEAAMPWSWDASWICVCVVVYISAAPGRRRGAARTQCYRLRQRAHCSSCGFLTHLACPESCGCLFFNSCCWCPCPLGGCAGTRSFPLVINVDELHHKTKRTVREANVTTEGLPSLRFCDCQPCAQMQVR